MGLAFLFYTYLFGGVTFLPLVIFLFVYVHPKLQVEEDERDDEIQNESTTYDKLKATEIDENSKTGSGAYHSGWVTVTQEYLESTSEISSSTQSISESSDNKSAYSSLYKLVKNSEANGPPDSENGGELKRRNSKSSIEPISATSTSNDVQVNDDKKLRTSQKKHRFYAVLRHGNLFLYKNEKKTDVKHVIVLQGQVVAIWPRDLPDGQLFTKRTCICILKRDFTRPRRLSEGLYSKDSETGFSNKGYGSKITTYDILSSDGDLELKPPKGSFFLYCDTNIAKEDWYFALIRATKSTKPTLSDTTTTSNQPLDPLNPSIYAKSLHFKTSNMIDLIQTLHSSEGQFQTRWLNAIIGRIFLALQQTETLKDFLQRRIEKKLKKINKPGFLDDFQMKKIDVGNSAPYFTYPSLKEISPDGTLLLSTNVHYHGGLSIQIATKVNINLGARFKSREVDVLLSITFQKLEGRVAIKIKPAPSERIWYSFESEPDIELKIEPIVSSRQMNYNIITSTIEKKFKEAIKESLVLPNWDDFVFYDTTDEIYRGGIWDKTARQSTQQSKENHTKEHDTTSIKPDGSTVSDVSSIKSTQSDLSSVSVPTTGVSGGGVNGSGGEGTARMKIASTLNDFSKKLKKTKSSTTMSINEENCLSDGSLLEPARSNLSSIADTEGSSTDSDGSKSYGINTLKKMGKWYFKDSKPESEHDSTVKEFYKPPEMISNRRTPRKTSVSTISSPGTVPDSDSSQKLSINRKKSYDMFNKNPGEITGSPILGTSFDSGSIDLNFGSHPGAHRKRVDSFASSLSVEKNAPNEFENVFLKDSLNERHIDEGLHSTPTLTVGEDSEIFTPDTEVPKTESEISEIFPKVTEESDKPGPVRRKPPLPPRDIPEFQQS
ncbi:nucleus-vacuole junction protein 2 [[Candida] anglica]|uniref:Nucleus-vacuole junction protein 2 n=1 Tax=[Candida] anglica TaxID=148631 RepID=A0ABP0EFI2_9ASCO